jgi:hypothetical protein
MSHLLPTTKHFPLSHKKLLKNTGENNAKARIAQSIIHSPTRIISGFVKDISIFRHFSTTVIIENSNDNKF